MVLTTDSQIRYLATVIVFFSPVLVLYFVFVDVCLVTETVLAPPPWVRQCGGQPGQGSLKGSSHWKKFCRSYHMSECGVFFYINQHVITKFS